MANDDAELPRIELHVTCEAPGLPPERDLSRWVSLAAAAVNKDLPAAAEVSIRIVDEVESQAINRQFRGKNTPTNVLAFPAELASIPGLPETDQALLGDLVLCAPVVGREARDQGKAEADHWAHLVVHGFLHLLGFDHEADDEAAEMEAMEVRILASGGLENPYEDRRLT
ncbi:MAG: rRNA maturation RNase YbeY [Pseudomonadota bacterium]